MIPGLTAVQILIMYWVPLVKTYENSTLLFSPPLPSILYPFRKLKPSVSWGMHSVVKESALHCARPLVPIPNEIRTAANIARFMSISLKKLLNNNVSNFICKPGNLNNFLVGDRIIKKGNIVSHCGLEKLHILGHDRYPLAHLFEFSLADDRVP